MNSEWLMIIGMALVTFAVRYPLLVLVGRIKLSPTVVRALRYVPPGGTRRDHHTDDHHASGNDRYQPERVHGQRNRVHSGRVAAEESAADDRDRHGDAVHLASPFPTGMTKLHTYDINRGTAPDGDGSASVKGS